MSDRRPVYRRVLWNDAECRPRAPWRILAWVGASVPLVVLAVAPVVALPLLAGESTLGRWFPGRDPETVVVLVGTVAQWVALVPATLVVAYVVDRRELADLGLELDRAWGVELLAGLALGGGLIVCVFLLEYTAGWVTVTGTALDSGVDPATVALYTVVFLVASTGEEVVFRGYLLTNLAEGLRGRLGTAGASAVAVAVTALLFGVVHASNPGGNVLGVAVITLGGVLLGLAYVLTDSLAIPVGFHVGWNWFQGLGIGFPVSGLAVPPGLVRIEQGGPALATGGGFGPEAGLVGGAAFLAGIAAVVAWTRIRRGEVGVAPGFATPALRASTESE